MKRALILLAAIALVVVACGQKKQNKPAEMKTLVAYFSATGTTKGVAEKIAAVTGGTLYEIVPSEPYTDSDLDYNDENSRTTVEMNTPDARPELSGKPLSLEGFSTVYLGYPIWWGEEPRIMDTFVEGHDFGGAEAIPFCTSSSSGIGRSGKNLAENAKGGNWLDGRRFPGSVSEADLRTWIDGLK
jgi:flavodoxin